MKSYNIDLGLQLCSIQSGQNKNGVETAPQYIYNNGLKEYLKQTPLQYQIFGPNVDYNINSGFTYRHIYSSTLKMINQVENAFILGGDHSISIGTISALKKKTS